VAWTGVLTAIVKIGGVTLLTILALKAMTASGGIIDGFNYVIDKNVAAGGIWHQALNASAPHLTHYGAYNRMTVWQPPDHPLVPWTGTMFGFLAVGVWYGVMNQFIVQRVLGARDIWHARMGMVMAGYAKLFLPLIIVLPGLILFARHPQFMLADWATANHRADGGFVVLVREFFPAGLRGLLLAVLICAVQSTISSVVNATGAILTFDIYAALINKSATEKQKVRFGIWASFAAILAGIAMAIAISRMDAGIYQYMQTINALVAPPFAAILWVGLLWKRTNGAGAIAAIITGFGVGIAFKVAAFTWPFPHLPGWFYPFGNQAPVCLALSMLACILGTLAHPTPTPGTDPDPVTFWNSGETLRQGLGEKWYSSVVLWAGLSLLLTLAAMVIFSQLFFPTGTGP